ncbi:Uncharacterised protein [Mycobacteroides abscessus subsp. abscessus]|nr:Uncharacterised protein [Mycobacteroides abscessus subsp. abscessus]
MDAGAQYHDRRILHRLRRDIDQRQPQCLRERRGWPRRHLLVQIGRGMGDHPPVRHRITGTGRCLCPIRIHTEVAGGGAADIAPEQKQLVPPRQGHAVSGPHIAGMREEQLGRQCSGTDQFLRSV